MAAPDRPGPRRPTIPGAYIHAVAVDNLVRGDGLTMPAAPTPAALVLGAGAVVALVGLRYGLVLAALGGSGVIVAGTIAGIAAFAHGVVVPVVPMAGAATVSLGLTALYRYAVVDRSRRRIRRAFAFYLPAAFVDRLAQQDRLPELGGEIRHVTVLFADIAGFTGMAERHDPAMLVEEVNRYFEAISRIIVDQSHGFLDRYLGDAVLAMFGAPADDPEHAQHAVDAALRVQALLAEGDFRIAGRPVRARIGINTGRALIGNIGAVRHFSYTAMGDDVNLASRIEAANKQHGTSILVSATTMRACAGAFAFREVATVRVPGRVDPVTLFEPLGAAGSTSAVPRARAEEIVR
jgi:class 3 adenylate cyclase